MSAPKTARRKQKADHDHLISARVTTALKMVLQKEATKERRTMSNFVRKILLEEMISRGAFAPNKG